MLDSLMNDYRSYMKDEKKLTKNTLDAYFRDVNQFNEYIVENKLESILEINKTNIITYLLYLQRTGKAASTISRNLASIRCLFQYLLNKNIIIEDPTLNLKSPKKEKKIPSFLSIDEVNTLLNQPNINEAKGSRDKAMLELLYATGLRVSEINSLNISDVNLDLGYIKLQQEEDTRVIPLGKIALKSINEYIKEHRTGSSDNEALFLNYNGCRLTRQGFWKIIKSYAKKASIEKSITPQTLRNSFAVHLINNGADIKSVQEILGHSDVATTQVYSLIAKKEALRDVYNKSHPRA